MELAAPPAPDSARSLFGDTFHQAEHFTRLLCTTGISHGLIGPREVDRIWERHVLNCAVVADLLPQSCQSVIDIGSGAGLPGLALAIRRPEMAVHLVEPLERRVTWLTQAVAELGLTNVTIHRGKAAAFHRELNAEVVTARAVAPLSRLVPWSLPLLSPGGRLLALKGRSASEELAAMEPQLRRMGASGEVVECGQGAVTPTTRVVQVTLVDEAQPLV